MHEVEEERREKMMRIMMVYERTSVELVEMEKDENTTFDDDGDIQNTVIVFYY